MTWNVDAKGESICRCCPARATDLHHIVPRSVSRRGRDEVELNGLPLCHECHMAHHRRERLIPLDALEPQEIAFAIGAAGREWLELWYPRHREEALV